MKKIHKLRRSFSAFWVLASIFYGLIFILLVFAILFVLIGAPKNDERAHRNWLLYMQVGEVGKSLDAYALEQGIYPEKIESIHDAKICVFHIKQACTTITYKPSSDRKSFKLAAKGLRGDIFYYSSGDNFAQTAHDRTTRMILARKDLTYYLEGDKYFSNPKLWPSYEELEMKID